MPILLNKPISSKQFSDLFARLCDAAANANIHEEGKNNHGPQVKKFLACVGLEEGEPWCAACLSFYALKAMCLLLGIPFTPKNAAQVFWKHRDLLGTWFKASGSCGDILRNVGPYGKVIQRKDIVKIPRSALIFHNFHGGSHAEHVESCAKDWIRGDRDLEGKQTKIQANGGNTSDGDPADGDDFCRTSRSFATVVCILVFI